MTVLKLLSAIKNADKKEIESLIIADASIITEGVPDKKGQINTALDEAREMEILAIDKHNKEIYHEIFTMLTKYAINNLVKEIRAGNLDKVKTLVENNHGIITEPYQENNSETYTTALEQALKYKQKAIFEFLSNILVASNNSNSSHLIEVTTFDTHKGTSDADGSDVANILASKKPTTLKYLPKEKLVENLDTLLVLAIFYWKTPSKNAEKLTGIEGDKEYIELLTLLLYARAFYKDFSSSQKLTLAPFDQTLPSEQLKQKWERDLPCVRETLPVIQYIENCLRTLQSDSMELIGFSESSNTSPQNSPTATPEKSQTTRDYSASFSSKIRKRLFTHPTTNSSMTEPLLVKEEETKPAKPVTAELPLKQPELHATLVKTLLNCGSYMISNDREKPFCDKIKLIHAQGTSNANLEHASTIKEMLISFRPAPQGQQRASAAIGNERLKFE